MIAPKLKRIDLTGSVTFRLLVLLSLILLPLGAIAIYQTGSLAREVERRAEVSLLSRTLSGITEQAQILERAIGATEALAQMTPSFGGAADCDADFFRRFTEAADQFIFSGRLESDLTSRCNAFGTFVDISSNTVVQGALTAHQSFAYSTPKGQASGIPVVVIGHPVIVDDAVDHFAVLSLATHSVVPQIDDPGLTSSRAVIAYNATGDILASNSVSENPLSEMPAGTDLSWLGAETPGVFRAEAGNGAERVYVVIPLRDGLIHVLASYPTEVLAATGVLPAWVLPFLMWLATLIVVYVAIARLVVTPVRHLARRMRRFAKNRATPSPLPMGRMPLELREMNSTFEDMANAILRDEAELEDALREKSILVREIHHRVKNNLQLIASIMNMQIRKSRMSETSEVVRRLQERVLGLATVHRQMYESSSLTDVEIGPLLKEILRQVLRQEHATSPDITMDIGDAALIPDQAVPLALLAAEASMNAIRFVGQNESGRGWINVVFALDDQGECKLVVENTVTPNEIELQEIKGGTRGLGTQLIHAFAAQLGGGVEVEDGRDVYRITVKFSQTLTPNTDDAAEVIRRVRESAA